MVDTEESKQRKGTITEEDVCTLLQRYSAATVLALFKEMAQVVDVKLDWKELVKKTETGIKSAREYQMLWRHLAYRQPLIEKIDPEDQPLDDDSDLEYELEAFPPATSGDALEASNCVKILTSRSTTLKPRLPNSSTVEVPRVSSANPLVQKQSQVAGTSGEGLNTNLLNSNNQRKRKLLSEEDDLELIAPVKKEVKGEKNSTQRTQRANVIKKKQGTGGASTPLSAVQLATRHALDMALKDGPTTGGTVGNENGGSANAAKISASKRNLPITKVTALPSQPNSSPVTSAAASGKPVPIASSSKLCPQKTAPLTQSSINADPIQAAAVAAGARIMSTSDVASIFKASQSKNAVHIKGAPPVKTSLAAISSSLPPNVHLICTGTSTPPTTVASGTPSPAASGQQPKGSAVGSTVPSTSQPPKVRNTSTVSKEQSSNATTMTRVQEDAASAPQCLPKAPLVKCQESYPSGGFGQSKQTTDAGKIEGKHDNCKQVVEDPVPKKEDKPHAVQGNCISSVNEAQGISTTVVADEVAAKIEASVEGLPGAQNS